MEASRPAVSSLKIKVCRRGDGLLDCVQPRGSHAVSLSRTLHTQQLISPSLGQRGTSGITRHSAIEYFESYSSKGLGVMNQGGGQDFECMPTSLCWKKIKHERASLIAETDLISLITSFPAGPAGW